MIKASVHTRGRRRWWMCKCWPHLIKFILICHVASYVRRPRARCFALGTHDILQGADEFHNLSDFGVESRAEAKSHQVPVLSLKNTKESSVADTVDVHPTYLRQINGKSLDTFDEYEGQYVFRPYSRFNVRRAGAVGDGITNDTDAFLAAWAQACESRNAEVYVPPQYTFLVYPSTYSGSCRGSTRFVAEGTIVAPEEISAWDGRNVRYWLLFQNLNRFSILGRGLFNGRGQNWWVCRQNSTCPEAPTAVTVFNSSRVTVRNVNFLDSQQIHINFQKVNGGLAKNITITAPWSSPNTDGIHISGTTNFAIQNCYVSTGDDCVSIVTGSHNIAVQNTYCGKGCHGISVGSLGANGQHANVTQVQVENCQLESTTNGVRIKTWQGGTGIASNFDFRNIKMTNVSNPIVIDQYYCPPRKYPNRVQIHEAAPCLDIRMTNISIVRTSGAPARAMCINAHGIAYGTLSPPSCLDTESSKLLQRFTYTLENYHFLRRIWNALVLP